MYYVKKEGLDELIDSWCQNSDELQLCWMEAGTIIQRSGASEQLKEQVLVHYLGTDMHNSGERSPETEHAEKWLQQESG